MLNSIFISILNMSIVSSYVIVLVLIIRLLLKKAPKIFSFALWAVVLFRLLCPFSFESVLSIMPSNMAPISHDILYSQTPQINTGIDIVDNSINHVLPVPTMVDSVNPLQVRVFIGSMVWIIGMMVLLIYSITAWIKLRYNLKGNILLRENIYLADHLSSPFVMGLTKPKIYLPSSLSEHEQDFIIAHEAYHIKRFDHLTRILAFMALTVHWFNPLVWMAFVLSDKDMEMSCDETVMKTMGTDIRAAYSESLLRFATGKKFITATPLAFGEGDTKDRVKNVMKYKKPMLWVSMVAVVVVICISLGLISNSKPIPVETNGINVENLWKSRTQYVGNNVAVGNILAELTFPEKLKYNKFQLFADEPPYAITVNFTTDPETRNFYTGALNQAPLMQNAIIMFSLIENVEIINFNLDDGKTPYSESFYRDSAQAIMEEEKLFAKTETVESLNDFIKETEKKVKSVISSINAKVHENQGVSDFKGVELYVWKNEKNETYFTLLSGTNRNKTKEEIYDKNVATTDISTIANALLGFDDGLHLFIIQMSETDFTKDEMVAYEQEITTYLGDSIKDYSSSIGLFKAVNEKDVAIDATKYNTEADFLNRPEGVEFQAAAYKAAKAYLNGDKEELAARISKNCIVDVDLDLFKDLDYMVLKWSLDDIKADDKIHVAYEFKLKGNDLVSFVSMELIKVDGEWKVDSIGIEK